MHKHHSPGFTLIELLVVLTIISMLMGMSSAIITQFSQRLEPRVASRQLAMVLRAARSFSLENRSQARVEITTTNVPHIEAFGFKNVGVWHLEDEVSTGALQRPAQLNNSQVVPAKIGKGVEVAEKGFIDCGEFRQFDIRYGFSLELWLQPFWQTSNKQTIWQIGDFCSLFFLPDHRVFFQNTGAEPVFLSFVLPLHRWTHLKVSYWQGQLQFFVNGNLTTSFPLENEYLLVAKEDRLIVGKNLRGKIDEIYLQAFVPISDYLFPETVSLLDAPSQVIWNQGSLDLNHHLSGSSFTLQSSLYSHKSWQIDISPSGLIAVREQN